MTMTAKGRSLLGYSAALAILASTTVLSSGALAFDLRADIAGRAAALQDELNALIAATETLVSAAETEDRDLTDEELETVTANNAKAEKLKSTITALSGAASLTASAGRKTGADQANLDPSGRIIVGARRDAARQGFSSFGEFAAGVCAHGRGLQNDLSKKVVAAATTYGNESNGADGGFAVPPEFRTQIWQKVMAEENLLTRTDQLETSSNNMTFPKDETTPWQNTGGVQVYWESEMAAAQQSKPQLEMSTMRLSKLMGLVPVSEELLEDAPGLESWLRAKAPAKMAAKINTAIIDGTGVGQPLGILRAGCTVSVPKETSQPADSIWGANIVRMWGRMYAPCRRNAVWLINQDVEPSLDLMGFAPLGAAKAVVEAAIAPLYIPAGGLSGSPYATMKGRPVIPVEACKTLGDKGDVILADLTQYMTLRKSGQDIRTDVSMHLFFDQAALAFRFIFRVNGQPWWGSAIQPQNGNLTRSCFVTLDERS
ncbi:MAG: phage major capsid protein [Alphaproteobacteria bacterium]